MTQQDLLLNVEGWNVLLSGILRTGDLSSMDSDLQQMSEKGVRPNLATFKVLVAGLAALRERHAHSLAIYEVWRKFVKELGCPDVELLSQLLRCCRKCGDVERGLFFLRVADKCRLRPNLECFRQLLMVCMLHLSIQLGCLL